MLTTRCSSAFALIASCGVALCAQSPTLQTHPTPKQTVTKVDRTPPGLLPTEPLWTLVLFNQLTVPPAYDDTHAFFSIEGDRVVAYDLPSGKQAWLVSARPRTEPAAGAGMLFLVEPDALTALRAADGSIAWQLPFTEQLAVRLAFDNGWLVAATDAGEILAFRASDGELIWRRNVGSRAHAPVVLAADRVYVPTADGLIVALRVDNGQPMWERRLGGAPNEVLALDKRLYVGAEDNFFYCLMTEDGGIDWRWRTGGDVIGQPISDGRRVYFVALDNLLRALDLNSGVQQWMSPLPMRPITGPVRAGSTILVTGQAALLHAYDVKDGKVAAGGGTITPGASPPAAPLKKSSGSTPSTPGWPETGDPFDEALLPGETIPAIVSTDTPPAVWITIKRDAEIAAPPHVFRDPQTRLPMVLMITRDIARGAAVTMVRRSFEPTITLVSPLPNLITFGPPTTPKP